MTSFLLPPSFMATHQTPHSLPLMIPSSHPLMTSPMPILKVKGFFPVWSKMCLLGSVPTYFTVHLDPLRGDLPVPMVMSL